MKRRLISLLCVLSMVGLCLCGCQPRPADPDAYHFQISQQENGTYTREAFLYRAATELKGFYVPSLYNIAYNEDGTIVPMKPYEE